MRIGILGGTFDPIHFGHVWLAEQAYDAAMLDEVWFIPAGMPPHKQHQQVTSGEHRVQMVKCAIQLHSAFSVSTIEVDRPGPSYTVDTLRILKESHPSAEFFLLMGADMVKDLLTWYRVEEILQMAQVIALGRSSHTVKMSVPYVTWIEKGVETNLSSTWLRQRLLEGRSIRYMVPNGVWQYIKEHQVYGY